MTHFEKLAYFALTLLTIGILVLSVGYSQARNELNLLKATYIKVDVSVYPQLTNSIIIQFKVPK